MFTTYLQAFASFASALAADGGHQETLTSCGRLYKSCGLLVESVESYRAAHALEPASQDVNRALAVVLTDLGVLHPPAAVSSNRFCPSNVRRSSYMSSDHAV